MKLSFFYIFCFIVTSSIAQTADVREGCAPLTVTFQAPASATSTYFWDFKDGVTSDKRNPTNIFTKPGTYLVSFQELQGGASNTIEIKVYDTPVLKINSVTGCAPYTAVFQNLTTLNPAIIISRYTWIFGDGQSYDGLDSPRHLYTTPKKYNPSLTIETNFKSCNLTVAFENTVEVLPPPIAAFTTDPANTISCKDTLNVTFTNTSINTLPVAYKWTFGNGNTSDLQQPSTSQRFIKGRYTANLLVSYPAIAGCSTQASRTISAGAPDPKIYFSRSTGILENDTTCLGNVVRIRTDVPGFYSWNFGTGAVPATSARDTNFVRFTKGGLQKISLNYTSVDRSCTSTKTDTLFVDEITADIQSTPYFSCSDPGSFEFKGSSNQTNVAYKWTFTGGATVATQNVIHQFKTDTDSLYFGRNIEEKKLTNLLVVSNLSGCTATDTITNILHLPNALFMADTVRGCAPLSVVLSDSSTSRDKITSWKWLFDDGSDALNPDNKAVAHTYPQAGEYRPRLVVRTERGCVDTSYAVLIEVGNNISTSIDFTASKSEVCPGEPVTFTFNGTAAINGLIDAYHYSTEGSRSSHCLTDKNYTHSYNSLAGPQQVTLLVDYNGCYSTLTKPTAVIVKGAIAQIDYNMLCNASLIYTFISRSQQAETLAWDFGDATSGSNQQEIHPYSSKGNYTVKLTAANTTSGCAPSVAETIVRPRQLQSKITSDTLLCINAPYTFNAAGSTDVLAECYTGYTWQFPNQSLRPHTSSIPSSVFRFPTAGNHTARLITKDINGCKDTATIRFKVFDIAVKPASDKVSICNPAIVQFTDLSISDTLMQKWNWYFGEGETATTKSPLHNYNLPPLTDSIYRGKLVITDALGCKDSATFTLKHYKPTSRIVVTDPTLCLGDTAKLSASDFTAAGSTLTYQWDLGNGRTVPGQKVNVVFDTAKSYNVKLSFAEVATGCTGSAVSTIQLQSYPKAGFTTDVDTLDALCAPQNVTFKDASQTGSPLTYNWNFGNQQTSVSTNPSNLFKTTYRKGNFTATYRVSTTFGCSDTQTKTFTVFSPEGDFDIVPDKIICKGDSLTFRLKNPVDVSSYTWAFGDGNVQNDLSQVTHKYNFHPPGGQTLARLVLRGVNGICPVVVQKPVQIQQVIADFERLNGDADTSICFVEGNYHLKNTSTSYTGFAWDFGDGTTSTQSEVDHKFASPGIYNVRLTVQNNTAGCVDTIIKKAAVNKNPVVQTVGDTVCVGKDSLKLYVLNPTPGSTYRVVLGDIILPIASPQYTFPSRTNVYSRFIEEDTNGCRGQAEVSGIVIQPSNYRDLDTSIVIGDQIALPVTGANIYNYTWTPEAGLSCLQCNYPLIRPLENTTYHLEIKDILGCFTSSNDFKISIRQETFVKLPTAFTPNEDGNNDTVYVKGWGIKELLDFQIFNRWGQLVFQTTNLSKGWDGRFNGELQNSDVYVYKVRVKTWRDQELFNEGYINLIY